MRILRIGSTGPSVEMLQLALNRAGYGELETDGIFGPLTEAALRKFQTAQGLVPDGIAGRETHRALLPWYTGNLLHKIQKGDTFYKLAEAYGATVEAIQAANPKAAAENLQIGETLVIPLPFPVVPTAIRWSAALADCCVRGLAARYPFIETGEIGQSVMGKPLHSLRLGTGENRVLYNAEHHANEWITTPLLLKFTEDLAAASVAGEKTSRVMETLVVSAKPSRILIGKCLGMGLLGLCQFGGTLLFTFICWKTLIPEGFTLFGEELSLSAFTPGSALLVLLFFILGYSLYAMLNAVCGALVDKAEDLNNAMMPVMLISIGSFYLSYFTAIMGTTYDYLVNLAMYLPFSAPLFSLPI